MKGEGELSLVQIAFDSVDNSTIALNALQNHKLTPFHFVKLKYAEGK